ncbi:MAG: hypothetical protein J6O61_10650 [Butyrivibrio sp.]|uniref:CIS tube protein n=1 Tax=Butyrivibrio sp. TaxID=28121 RepID=UPI001B1183BA|nr:hypothetical protein [Butyrivibrio sp.]MBO6241269.1 hypothetical protein [Butyrivibrio sp.]
MAQNVLGEWTSSLKGMFVDGAAEKAILYIYIKDISQNQNQGQGNAAHKSDDNMVKSMVKMQNTLTEKAKKSLGIKDILKGIGSDIKNIVMPGKKAGNGVGEIANENRDFVKFTVQYNPESIKLTSFNGKIQHRTSDEGNVAQLRKTEYNGKTTMSFDLVFDDCDNVDAFMLNDLVNMNFTSAINKGLNMYQKGDLTTNRGKNSHSVRKRMDAIMSLLSHPDTQQVIFFWSRMVFRGMVTSVRNTYTMFNPAGNPIRGKMHIEITQDREKTDLKYDESYWDNSYKEIFKQSKSQEGDADADKQGMWNKLSNNAFLNINI